LAGIGCILATVFVCGALLAEFPYCFLLMIGSGVVSAVSYEPIIYMSIRSIV
jgi:hypothetical protein